MAAANPAKAISIAGLTCGAMDISAALVVYGLMGSKPLRLLQGIAGGILGPRTYSGGKLNRAPRPSIALRHRFRSRGSFLPRQPRRALAAQSRRRVRRPLRRRRLLLHESRRSATLRSHKIPLFRKNDAHRGHHPHLLRRHSHLSQHSPLRPLNTIPDAAAFQLRHRTCREIMRARGWARTPYRAMPLTPKPPATQAAT